jgi:hypothetical protein
MTPAEDGPSQTLFYVLVYQIADKFQVPQLKQKLEAISDDPETWKSEDYPMVIKEAHKRTLEGTETFVVFM